MNATFLAPIVFLFLIERGGRVGALIESHACAFIGIPWAGGAAAVVVMLFRFLPGELTFKALGLELKGAAAPAVLWVVCFVALVLALKVLW